MYFLLSFASILGVAVAQWPATTTYEACPLLGPAFLAPLTPRSDAAIKAGIAAVSAQFSKTVSSGVSNYGPFDSNTTSFSASLWSANDGAQLAEWAHTAPGCPYSGVGVKTVDSNTIYRIGSLSKLFTIYAYLIEIGDGSWNQPITNFVPELAHAAAARPASNDPIANVAWHEITVGLLASHMAGIGREYAFQSELTQQVPDLTPYGFPPLPAVDIPACGISPLCDRAQFFAGFTQHPPIFAPDTTAIYSNVAFQIVAYALEGITGKKFSDIFHDIYVNKLGLKNSFISLPVNDTLYTSRAYVPDSLANSAFTLDGGDEDPAGSCYSTVNDITTLGRGILNSQYLSPTLTRRWMKPVARTDDITWSLGAPWEIHTYTYPDSKHTVDHYDKSGTFGAYASLLVLIPDYAMGFSIMTAGANPRDTNDGVAQIMTDILMPAFQAAALAEADAVFSGTYTSSNHGLNSSIVLSTTSSQPGLTVSSWVSNSTDMFQTLGLLLAGDPTAQISVRLYPSNLVQSSPNGSTQHQFRAVFEAPAADPGGLYTDTCYSWANLEDIFYGRLSLDEFVFTIEKNGKATAVLPSALRATLHRE